MFYGLTRKGVWRKTILESLFKSAAILENGGDLKTITIQYGFLNLYMILRLGI